MINRNILILRHSVLDTKASIDFAIFSHWPSNIINRIWYALYKSGFNDRYFLLASESIIFQISRLASPIIHHYQQKQCRCNVALNIIVPSDNWHRNHCGPFDVSLALYSLPKRSDSWGLLYRAHFAQTGYISD